VRELLKTLSPGKLKAEESQKNYTSTRAGRQLGDICFTTFPSVDSNETVREKARRELEVSGELEFLTHGGITKLAEGKRR
jgi:hypothetical protein